MEKKIIIIMKEEGEKGRVNIKELSFIKYQR